MNARQETICANTTATILMGATAVRARRVTNCHQMGKRAKLNLAKRSIHHGKAECSVQERSLIPTVPFLAIPDMIWLDLSPELAYHLQDGVEMGVLAK